MEELFLPIELAVIANKKGYKGIQLARFDQYEDGSQEFYLIGSIPMPKGVPVQSISTPLYQQILDWLSDKHRIRVYSKPSVSGHFTYGIYTWLGGAEGWEQHTGIVTEKFNTDNESLAKGLEEAFKLI